MSRLSRMKSEGKFGAKGVECAFSGGIGWAVEIASSPTSQRLEASVKGKSTASQLYMQQEVKRINQALHCPSVSARVGYALKVVCHKVCGRLW